MGGSYDAGTVFPLPGEGTLIAVELVPADKTRAQGLTLVVEHRGRQFTGQLFAADPKEPGVLDRLYEGLKKFLNRALLEIGRVEFDL
jgi:hypothetical protein